MKPAKTWLRALCGAAAVMLSPVTVFCQNARIWISTESELLAQPTDLVVGADGSLLVLDALNSGVLVLKEPGVAALRIGRAGSGPGEFKGARTLQTVHGGFEVVDGGNNRLQRFDASGQLRSTRPLPPGGANYPAALSPRGDMAVNTVSDSLLLTVFDTSNVATARFVSRAAAMPQVVSMRAARQEIQAGKVPAFFGNTLQPQFDPTGSVWVAHMTAGKLQLWSPRGRLRAEHQLDEPEMDAIRRTFFGQYRDPSFTGLKILSYVADMDATQSGLWVLLNVGDDASAVLVLINRDGQRVGRWVLGGIRGAGRLAVDETRRRLFLGIPSTAQVVEIPLPQVSRQ